MRKFTTLMVLFILLAVGCTKETYQSDAPAKGVTTDSPEYIFKVLQDAGVKDISYDQVVKAMNSRSSEQPCSWDFDQDGLVGTSDLLIMIEKFGTEYTTEDLFNLLGVYRTEYIVDVIPVWQNFIQGSSCNTDWDNIPRYSCQGELIQLEINRIDSIHWIQNDSIVWTSPYELNWKTYSTCQNGLYDGYAPECNGIQIVSQRLFMNGESYFRTNVGWALVDGGPEMCDGNIANIEGFSLSASSYEELQYHE